MNLKKDKISGIQKALKAADKDNDKKIDITEFRTELKGLVKSILTYVQYIVYPYHMLYLNIHVQFRYAFCNVT